MLSFFTGEQRLSCCSCHSSQKERPEPIYTCRAEKNNLFCHPSDLQGSRGRDGSTALSVLRSHFIHHSKLIRKLACYSYRQVPFPSAGHSCFRTVGAALVVLAHLHALGLFATLTRPEMVRWTRRLISPE